MQARRLRRLIGVSSIAVAALTLAGPQGANAATLNQSPYWFTSQIQQVRLVGSEATYYVYSRLTGLYNQTNIFGCVLQTTDLRTCNTAADTADTDTLDNYSRNEITNGLANGASAGIGQMCGNNSGGLPVDAVRSTRAFNSSTDCADTVFWPLMKDALVGLNFRSETMPSGSTFGNVANGWRTGDDVNCGNAGFAACSGVPFNNVDNTGGTSSIAYRIWCDKTSTGISDWGQLTDPAQPVGSGAPIGVPIVIWGVPTSSGIYKLWNNFVGCDQNTKAVSSHFIQQNNAPQIRKVAASEGGGAGTAATEQEIAQSLYFLSFAAANSNPYVRGGGSPTQINGVAVKPANVPTVASTYTASTVYRKATSTNCPDAATCKANQVLRGSTAGFLNWISITDSTVMPKGTDLTNGRTYQSEINNAISTQFGFVQIVNSTPIPSADVGQPTV